MSRWKTAALAAFALAGCTRAPGGRFVDVSARSGLDFLHTTGAAGAATSPRPLPGPRFSKLCLT